MRRPVKHDSNESRGKESITTLEQLALEVLVNPECKIQDLVLALAMTNTRKFEGEFIERLSNEIPQQIIANTLSADVDKIDPNSFGFLNATQCELILGLCQIWATLKLHFDGREDVAQSWLHVPKRPLGGEMPIRLMNTSAGQRCVLDMLKRMELGDFS